MAVLRSIYGNDIPEPSRFLISRWSKDENTYGAYSYIPLGMDASLYDDMASSVADTVFFAGEATNREHHSTVHGAYLSGKREAAKIVEL